MAGKAEAARAALKNVEHLHPVFHQPIVDALDAAGLLDKGGEQWQRVGPSVHARATGMPTPFKDIRRGAVLTVMQAAANPQNHALLRIVKASANRYGVGHFFADETKPIDLHGLDVALREKKIDLDDRFRFKGMLNLLKLVAP